MYASNSDYVSSGANTSGALGNLLGSIVQTGGNFLVARENAKATTVAANTVKSQAQIDAENQQKQMVAVSSVNTQYIAYSIVALVTLVIIVKVLK